MIVFEFWFWHSCSWLWQVYMGWKVNNISKMLSFEGMEWWTFGYHRCPEYSPDPNPVCLLTSKLGLNWHPGFVYSLFQSISELANIDLHRFCSQLCHSFNFNWSFTQRLESSNRLCDKCLFFFVGQIFAINVYSLFPIMLWPLSIRRCTDLASLGEKLQLLQHFIQPTHQQCKITITITLHSRYLQ